MLPEVRHHHHVVAALSRPHEGLGSHHGRDPDGRVGLLGRPRERGYVLEAVESPLERDVLFRPQPVQKRRALVQFAAALLERITEGGEFLWRVAGAYSQNQPTARDRVDHRSFFGNHHGMVKRKQKNARAQMNAACPACDGGKSDQRRGM